MFQKNEDDRGNIIRREDNQVWFKNFCLHVVLQHNIYTKIEMKLQIKTVEQQRFAEDAMPLLQNPRPLSCNFSTRACRRLPDSNLPHIKHHWIDLSLPPHLPYQCSFLLTIPSAWFQLMLLWLPNIFNVCTHGKMHFLFFLLSRVYYVISEVFWISWLHTIQWAHPILSHLFPITSAHGPLSSRMLAFLLIHTPQIYFLSFPLSVLY